jgi:hypothetical protein
VLFNFNRKPIICQAVFSLFKSLKTLTHLSRAVVAGQQQIQILPLKFLHVNNFSLKFIHVMPTAFRLNLYMSCQRLFT